MHLFGRVASPTRCTASPRTSCSAGRATTCVHKIGQDGGFVSALLIWAMDEGYIDCALTSFLEGDGTSWKAIPGLATNKDEILASAGSRYTYSANTLAMKRRSTRASRSSPSSA